MNNYHRIQKNKKGAAAIFTIVIIGAASLIMVKSVAFLSLSSLEMVDISRNSESVAYVTEGCAEEALRRLMTDNSYVVTDNNFSYGDGSCVLNVSQGGGDVTIESVGTLNSYVKKINIELTISDEEIDINKWESVDI